MKLYEISETRLRFLEAIESGEIPEEAIADTLAAIDGDFDSKADDIACFIKSLLAETEALNNESAVLADRAKAKKNKADKLVEYLYQQFKLSGKSKLETSRNVLAIRKNPPSVQIVKDDDFVVWAKENNPDLLTIKDPVPNKKEIKIALQGGAELPGAELVQGEKLSIK